MPRRSPTKTEKEREAKRLKSLRGDLGWSQREMAEEFKVVHSAITQWETGSRTIPGPVLRLIEIYGDKKIRNLLLGVKEQKAKIKE